MKTLKFIISILVPLLFLFGCKGIVNQMAFHPDTRNVIPSNRLSPNVKELFIETEDSLKIHTYFIPSKLSRKVLIYFHGNAGNIGHRLPDLLKINESGVNVFGVSYRGYGKSEGKPDEAGIYMDGRAALEYVSGELGFSIENVYILGRSIGTTVAINTSQNLKLGGLVLVSPLTSGKDHAKASGLRPVSFLAGNAFNNIGKCRKIICPVLVVHGTRDRVIPFFMGEEIFKKLKTRKKFIKIEGRGHNDLTQGDSSTYWNPILEFILKTNT
jgi:fermentation-respiration switch protein FrsA (DUF1100 family)